MIIAEAGTAWGYKDKKYRYENLMYHIFVASVAKADVFKMQMFILDEPLFCPMPGDEKRWEWWSNCILSFEDWELVKESCERVGMEFMASAFQHTAVDWLNRLGVNRFKVASRAVETFPYEKVKNAELIISNATKLPAGRFLGLNNLTTCRYLHCRSQYPTPLSSAMWPDKDEKEWMKGFSGLSDHSGTPWPAIDALARGAEIVEVHFKTEYSRGPDLASSVTTDELKMICDFQKALKEMRG